MGDEPAGDSAMTKFYYCTTVDEAVIIAQRGRILSPVAGERAWLKETQQLDTEYYNDLMKGKTLDGLAHELALTDLPPEKAMEIEYITLADSINKALLLMIRNKEPKVVLSADINHPKETIVHIPGPLYVDGDTEVHIYQEAIEHKTDLMKAFGKYTKRFFHVKKK